MILYVPNTAIQCENGKHYLPRPDFEFLKSLSEDDKKIIVIGFVSERIDPFSDSALDDIDGVDVFSLGQHSRYSGKVRKLGFYIAALIRSLRLLNKHRGFMYLYFPGHMAKLLGLYYSVTGRQYGIYVRGIWTQEGLQGWVSRRLFRHAEFIFTTGLGFRDTVLQYNTDVEPVFPMTTFTPEGIKTPERGGKAIRDILFVGHVRERKGVLDSIRAVGMLRNEGKDMCLHIIGGGDKVDLDAIERVRNESGLDDEAVIYHGHVSAREKLADFFSKSDLFLYPSYYPEGFPRVVYEAMIFGLPMVCTILPGMRGFIKDDVNCIEVDPRAPEQIAAALSRLFNSPEDADRLGKMAREMVTDYFDGFKIKGHVNQFRHKLASLKNDGNPF